MNTVNIEKMATGFKTGYSSNFGHWLFQIFQMFFSLPILKSRVTGRHPCHVSEVASRDDARGGESGRRSCCGTLTLDQPLDFNNCFLGKQEAVIYTYFWVNYNDLTVTKGNHPNMAVIQVSEIL